MSEDHPAEMPPSKKDGGDKGKKSTPSRQQRRKRPAGPGGKAGGGKRPPPNDEDGDDNENDCSDLLYGILSNAIQVCVEPMPMPGTKRKNRNPENNPAVSTYDAEHARFYDGLSKEKRARIAELERSLIDPDTSSSGGNIPKRFRLLESGVPEKIKAVVMGRVEGMFRNDSHPAEKSKMSKWFDSFLRIPFGAVKPLPVTHLSPVDDIQRFIASARDRLDANVYGHADAKKQIIRTVAKWISNPGGRGNVIGLQGPMGCGKTTLVKKCIAEALGLPMVMIPLGGVTDASVLTGHLYTYEGSTYGAVANCLMTAKCMNPVILLDELDKAGNEGHKGQEVYNTLIHMTDPVQNEHFVDNYFADVPLDLSRALMVFTFNHSEAINPILRDRMIVINASGYSASDKREIAKAHLLPSVLRQHGMDEKAVTVDSDAIDEIICRVDEEQGVRNLERALDTIVGNINLSRMLEGNRDPVSIDRAAVVENVSDRRSNDCSVQHIYL
nr:AAA family ATPase [Oceanusvirus sp.]